MTLRVPLTLTIIPALTVSVGGQNFAIPRSAIDEIVRANGESRHAGNARRRRGRHDPRPPRSRSRAGRRPRLEERHAGRGAQPGRPSARRRRRLCARGRPDPRSRGAGGQAGRAGGDGDRPLCRHHACRRRQPDPAVRSRPASPRSAASSWRRRSAPRDRRRSPHRRRRGRDAVSCCSAASTARAARFASRVVDRIEEVAGEAIRPGAGQLRVQLGETILPLAGVDGGAAGARRSACSA